MTSCAGTANSLSRHAVAADLLQTERFFPVPDAGHVHGRADLFDGCRTRSPLSYGIVPNLLVERGEIPAHEVEVEVDQLPIGFKEEN